MVECLSSMLRMDGVEKEEEKKEQELYEIFL